jgi:hypothetical protein
MKSKLQNQKSMRMALELDPSEAAYRERLDDRLARTPEDIYWMLFRKSDADHAKDLHGLPTQTSA